MVKYQLKRLNQRDGYFLEPSNNDFPYIDFRIRSVRNGNSKIIEKRIRYKISEHNFKTLDEELLDTADDFNEADILTYELAVNYAKGKELEFIETLRGRTM